MNGYRRELVDGHVTVSRRSKNVITDRDKWMPLLPLIARGMSNRLIAKSFNVSEDRIKEGLRALYTALGAADRAHAVAIGYNEGLLTNESYHAILPTQITEHFREQFRELAMGRTQTQESLALGAALSAVMVQAKLTQTELAKRLGRHPAYVNRMIYGKEGGSATHVVAWLDACNVTGLKRQEILAMALPCHLCGCRHHHVDSDNGTGDQ